MDTNHTSLTMLLLELLLPASDPAGVHPAWTKRIKEYLIEHWDETSSLEQLCKIAGVHPVTISKNFTRYFHCTLGEYLRKIKVEKAISLIKSSRHTLEEIGFICGFQKKVILRESLKSKPVFCPVNTEGCNMINT